MGTSFSSFFSDLVGESKGLADIVMIGGRRFSIELRIGRGTWGDIFVLEDTDSPDTQKKRYAVKVFKKKNLIKNQMGLSLIQAEKESLIPLHSPFLSNLLATDQDPYRLFSIYDLSLGGDLEVKKAFHKRLPERAVQQVAAATLLGLNYMHRAGLVHRDIKPSNILVDQDGYCRLCDFGLSGPPTAQGRHWGTLPYMAPETLTRGESTPLSDMWSLGITLFELFWGVLPWQLGDAFAPGDPVDKTLSPSRQASARTHSQIIRVNGLGTPDLEHELIPFTWGAHDPTWSENLAAFVARLTMADPSQRLSAEEAMAHAFIQPLQIERFGRHEFTMSSFLRQREDEYPFNMQHNLELEPRTEPDDAISLSDQHRFFDSWNWVRPSPPDHPDHFAHDPEALSRLHQDPRFLSSHVDISIAREDLPQSATSEQHGHDDDDDDDETDGSPALHQYLPQPVPATALPLVDQPVAARSTEPAVAAEPAEPVAQSESGIGFIDPNAFDSTKIEEDV